MGQSFIGDSRQCLLLNHSVDLRLTFLMSGSQAQIVEQLSHSLIVICTQLTHSGFFYNACDQIRFNWPADRAEDEWMLVVPALVNDLSLLIKKSNGVES